MERFSFHLLFVRNKTKSPTPAPTSSPEIIEPKSRIPPRYIWVIRTDAAQFGINPTIAANTGPNIAWLDKNSEIRSSPPISIKKFKTREHRKMNNNILNVCIKADFPMLFSQWQCSLSHIVWKSLYWMAFGRKRMTKSTINPVNTAVTSLIPRTFKMILPFTASDKKIGSISSEVDKNTATSVPIVMIPPEYRFEAATENPHCGKIPATPPAIGPSLPAFRIHALVFVLVLCSRYSMSR